MADGQSTRTLAIESEDAAAVAAAVRSVGLAGYVNTSYPRGLTALARRPSPRATPSSTSAPTRSSSTSASAPATARGAVVDRAEITRLGEGSRRTARSARGPRADDRRDRRAWSSEAKRHRGAWPSRPWARRACAPRATAASGGRRSDDATGVRVEVISGEEESRLAFLAVGRSGLDAPDALARGFDTGGGSTQFTFGHGDRRRRAVQSSRSVPCGSPSGSDSTARWRRDVLDEARVGDLGRLVPARRSRRHPTRLVGDGRRHHEHRGRQARARVYDPDVVQGTVLDRAEIDRQIELYRSRDADARRSIVGLQPKRARGDPRRRVHRAHA